MSSSIYLMSRFFITGLPRSRTAWFAVATTTDKAICLHEPSAKLSSYDHLAAIWGPNMGVSDSALALHIGRVLADFQPRTLIIERDIDDVLVSFERCMGAEIHPSQRGHIVIGLRRCREELNAWKDHHLVRTVKFEALQNFDVLQGVFAWLVPGKPIEELRQLAHMNIQCDPAHAMEMAKLGRGRWVFQA